MHCALLIKFIYCIQPMKVVAVCSLAQRANESDSSVQSSGESGPTEIRVMRMREGSIPFLKGKGQSNIASLM